jgi:hypothetical protein
MIALLTLAVVAYILLAAYADSDTAFAFAHPLTERRAGWRGANLFGAINAAYGTPPSPEEIEQDRRLAREQAEHEAQAIRLAAANTTTETLRGRLQAVEKDLSAARAKLAEAKKAVGSATPALRDEWAPKIAAAAQISVACKRATEKELDNAMDAAHRRERAAVERAESESWQLGQDAAKINATLVERRKLDGELAAYQTNIDAAKAATAELALAAKEGVVALAIVGSHADGLAKPTSDVDAVAVYAAKTSAAVAAAEAVVRRWAVNHGARGPAIEVHATHRPFAGSSAPIFLIGDTVPTEQSDLSDPGTALRAAALATLKRLPVQRVAVETIGSGRPDILANALAYCARHGVHVATLTTFKGRPFPG